MSYMGWFKSPKTQPHNFDISCQCCARTAHWTFQEIKFWSSPIYFNAISRRVNRLFRPLAWWKNSQARGTQSPAASWRCIETVREWQYPIQKIHSLSEFNGKTGSLISLCCGGSGYVRHHDGPPELLGRHLWWSHQQRFVFFVHRVVMGSFWVSCHFRDFGCFFFNQVLSIVLGNPYHLLFRWIGMSFWHIEGYVEIIYWTWHNLTIERKFTDCLWWTISAETNSRVWAFSSFKRPFTCHGCQTPFKCPTFEIPEAVDFSTLIRTKHLKPIGPKKLRYRCI